MPPWEAAGLRSGGTGAAPSSPQRCTPFAVSEGRRMGNDPGIPLLTFLPCSRPHRRQCGDSLGLQRWGRGTCPRREGLAELVVRMGVRVTSPPHYGAASRIKLSAPELASSCPYRWPGDLEQGPSEAQASEFPALKWGHSLVTGSQRLAQWPEPGLQMASAWPGSEMDSPSEQSRWSP